MGMMNRYHDALKQIPQPGSGRCHTNLLGVANLGVMAGLDAEQIFQDIRSHIPEGKRNVPDSEIMEAINKASGEAGEFTPIPRSVAIIRHGSAAFQKIASEGKCRTEKDLIASSPVNLDRDPGDPELFKPFFENLFKPEDLLFIGDRLEPGIMDKNIRRASDWLNDLWKGEKAGPYIIPNPLSGLPALKESGDGETYRGNNNISDFRYCVVEFDNIGKEDQIAFWSAVKLPVMALIDSGGKSIHAWLDVQAWAPVKTREQWHMKIKDHLYDRMLIPLGVDGACKNEARLSRLPGYFRTEKGSFQRLLWLRGSYGEG